MLQPISGDSMYLTHSADLGNSITAGSYFVIFVEWQVGGRGVVISKLHDNYMLCPLTVLKLCVGGKVMEVFNKLIIVWSEGHLIQR